MWETKAGKREKGRYGEREDVEIQKKKGCNKAPKRIEKTLKVGFSAHVIHDLLLNKSMGTLV